MKHQQQHKLPSVNRIPPYPIITEGLLSNAKHHTSVKPNDVDVKVPSISESYFNYQQESNTTRHHSQLKTISPTITAVSVKPSNTRADHLFLCSKNTALITIPSVPLVETVQQILCHLYSCNTSYKSRALMSFYSPNCIYIDPWMKVGGRDAILRVFEFYFCITKEVEIQIRSISAQPIPFQATGFRVTVAHTLKVRRFDAIGWVLRWIGIPLPSLLAYVSSDSSSLWVSSPGLQITTNLMVLDHGSGNWHDCIVRHEDSYSTANLIECWLASSMLFALLIRSTVFLLNSAVDLVNVVLTLLGIGAIYMQISKSISTWSEVLVRVPLGYFVSLFMSFFVPFSFEGRQKFARGKLSSSLKQSRFGC